MGAGIGSPQFASSLYLVEGVQHFRWLPCTLRFEVAVVKPRTAASQIKGAA